MSDYCPCCDNFSIDSARASKRLVNKKLPKITINVDNSDANADWIKPVKDKGIVESSHKDLNKEESV